MLTIESTVRLNNGVNMPLLGLGLGGLDLKFDLRVLIRQRANTLKWFIKSKITKKAIINAIKVGYRLFDTAKIYNNERIVGKAIRKFANQSSGIFVTTKLWNEDHGYDSALRAFEKSYKKFGMNCIDLYLLHWPVKKRLETWQAMENISRDGRCRAIGVCNFLKQHLVELLENCEIMPAVNQIEISPFNYLYQKETIDFCRENGIQVMAASPLTRGRKLTDANLLRVASKYSKTSAQILIRWALQHEITAIPKSMKPERIQENAHVYNFVIENQDMEYLDSLNENLITGWNPHNVK